jgi:hypothetical protein
MLGQFETLDDGPEAGLVGVKAQMHFVAPGTSILKKRKKLQFSNL